MRRPPRYYGIGRHAAILLGVNALGELWNGAVVEVQIVEPSAPRGARLARRVVLQDHVAGIVLAEKPGAAPWTAGEMQAAEWHRIGFSPRAARGEHA